MKRHNESTQYVSMHIRRIDIHGKDGISLVGVKSDFYLFDIYSELYVSRYNPVSSTS